MASHGPFEILEEAAILLAQHGKAAERFAWVNADQLNEHGNASGAAYWAQVANAVAGIRESRKDVALKLQLSRPAGAGNLALRRQLFMQGGGPSVELASAGSTGRVTSGHAL